MEAGHFVTTDVSWPLTPRLMCDILLACNAPVEAKRTKTEPNSQKQHFQRG